MEGHLFIYVAYYCDIGHFEKAEVSVHPWRLTYL